MKESEINEIKDAIALCHHLCDGQPLSGRYYKLMNAVLPLLEEAAPSDHLPWLQRYALDISRVINEKPVMTILEEKGKKDVKPTAYHVRNDLVAPTLSKSKLAELKAQGRVIEKPKPTSPK